MTLDPLSEEEFRKDEAAVKELSEFLGSKTGQKVLRVLATVHPLCAIADPRTLTPAGVRDSAVVEQANPHNILGMIKGFEACQQVISRLTRPPLKELPPVQTRAQKVVREMRKT